jgi:hypothetical protein
VVDTTKSRGEGFGSDLAVVIRKTPTITVNNKLGLPLLEPQQRFNSFSNSNTSSLPNVGGYGRTAELVNPTILFHSKSPTTLVKKIPAHLGYRNEKTSVTSFNKETGKTETHDIIQSKPIYGEVESIRNVNVNSIRQLDLQYGRYRKQRNIVQENAELNYQHDERHMNSLA